MISPDELTRINFMLNLVMLMSSFVMASPLWSTFQYAQIILY